MGMNRLYCRQFATVILVPSGMLSFESADASDAYAPGSKVTSARGAAASAVVRASVEMRIRRNLGIGVLRVVMISPPCPLDAEGCVSRLRSVFQQWTHLLCYASERPHDCIVRSLV